MLRSIFVIGIIVFGLSQALRSPFYGLLFYLWLAYFRPELWLWAYKHWRYRPADAKRPYPFYSNVSKKFEKLRHRIASEAKSP